MKRNVLNYALSLCVALLLAGCLPDDSQTSAVNGGEITPAQAKMDYVAQSLSSYALRSQYELAKSDKWRTGDFPENKINMSAADMGNAATLAVSAFCRDNGGSAYHMTWPKDKNSANGSMVSALSKRVASDSLGMIKEGGRIVTQAGKDIALSTTCKTNLSASMPIGAPVIVMALSLPANTDMAGQTKVLFETVACTGEREKGYKLMKVITKYDSAGKVETGYPQRTDASGGTCVETAISDAKAGNGESSILSNAGGFGASGIGALLKGTLGADSKVNCTKTKQEIVTGYDARGNPIIKKVDVADSCAAGAMDATKIDSIKEEDIEGDRWEPNDEIGQCRNGNGSTSLSLFDTPGVWSWKDWNGEYTSKRWIDYRKITETRGEETTTDTQLLRGPWVGDVIDCKRDEKFKANCADIPAVKALGKPYASDQLWVQVDVLHNNSWHFDNDWIDDLFGSTIACWFGCDKLIALDVTMMNRDYFDGLEVSGELHMWREAKITRWDNYEKFKPHVPTEAEKMKWKFDADASTCAVSIRTPLFSCSSGNTTINEEKDPNDLTAGNVLLHNTIANFYNYPRTADGAIMTTMDSGVDFDYLIINGKYPSEYSVGSLHWAIKSCGIKGCDTDHYNRMVHRLYIDGDKKGYQKVLEQGFYYTNKKVMYDENAGFYMTDLSITPSENARTRCEVVRLPERTQHDFNYKVQESECSGGSDGGCYTVYNNRTFHAEYIKRDLNNYLAQTPTKGVQTKTQSKHVCTQSTDGGYYYGSTSVKYCDRDPFAGKTRITCEDIGMYTRSYCTGYYGGDDGGCRETSTYCSNSAYDYYDSGGGG